MVDSVEPERIVWEMPFRIENKCTHFAIRVQQIFSPECVDSSLPAQSVGQIKQAAGSQSASAMLNHRAWRASSPFARPIALSW